MRDHRVAGRRVIEHTSEVAISIEPVRDAVADHPDDEPRDDDTLV